MSKGRAETLTNVGKYAMVPDPVPSEPKVRFCYFPTHAFVVSHMKARGEVCVPWQRKRKGRIR